MIRIDINTGSDQGGTPNFPMNEALVEYTEYTGYTQELVVSGLVKPAGIDVIGNRMIVSEYQTGEIIIYDISTIPAVELDRLSTGMSSVQGIKIGPNGLIWFVDENSDGVYRIETGDLTIDEAALEFNVYPNPTTGEINVYVGNTIEGTIEVRDIQGKLITSESIAGQTASLNVNVSTGLYFVNIISNGVKSETKRLVVK